MAEFRFIKTSLDGAIIIEPEVYTDERGYFMETFNEAIFQENGLEVRFVQDNESMSVRGVLRGLHFQREKPQGKLVRVIRGEIFDVAVDLRKNSDTYGEWTGVRLSDENRREFFIPEGFAHGFLALSDECIVNYKCTELYHPEYDSGIPWDDPDIGIDWPLEMVDDLIISEKDRNWKPLRENPVYL
ncbi:dTDP-4-dehydrorhamnose 3,5-epimerase [Methanothermobacter thermautotrophicus str. Delta H]|uniref:dTDP-4-dehydrorhamnose 3,5-epimerase n=2 Tax=Methanothermobacter thermautotrophicus TaxID=145262 RepID=RMLC_METTH|nr:dTDP-4-dehydrorhamnose 3,5-epimerase [Methanothermobacter thermautotrophicus]O27818.1 RecName: Full=dTDP-4-dehydrorhamnose 3,5-epimerase; AltName: Full=Thymidine diphospho-4-keto-rhamnose 3,5-epimerase; AltName: Full=dTDP-4-keto-6-deoxyglucose 3,5-epimerase; AltName: Full=dTDP-6-deoxy-D-xylo-4-hexulose 3,5-epimerase; AltName: Full=dTDP-L-rhamnose synthase [Methanothermobacter thermautotrophicus str. Delta H]1EP0_A Chain A, DTDP-6-DEOXY-D-XYLO-4-HEXULOSE 3,5-EPIMERASE [Methanothermobacter therm